MKLISEEVRNAKYVIEDNNGKKEYKIKGVFLQAEVKNRNGRVYPKHILLKEQNPYLDVRFIFPDSNKKIYKGSKTTYGDWCDRHGFLYADNRIPREWLK